MRKASVSGTMANITHMRPERLKIVVAGSSVTLSSAVWRKPVGPAMTLAMMKMANSAATINAAGVMALCIVGTMTFHRTDTKVWLAHVCRTYYMLYIPRVRIRAASAFSGHVVEWASATLDASPGKLTRMLDYASPENVRRWFLSSKTKHPQHPGPAPLSRMVYLLLEQRRLGDEPFQALVDKVDTQPGGWALYWLAIENPEYLKELTA